MGKSYEVKMKERFDAICGNACNEMGDVTYADLSNYITEKIRSMGEENAEWVKVRLQRKKVSSHEVKNMACGFSCIPSRA